MVEVTILPALGEEYNLQDGDQSEQVPELSSQLPALSVQFGNDFTSYVNEGLSQLFKIKHIDDGSYHGINVIEHDPDLIHYFAEERGIMHTSQRTFGRTPYVINKEFFDMKVDSSTDLRKLKDDLLSKPFMLEVFFTARREVCGGTYKLPRTCLIVTVNPKHPSIATLLSNAFSQADESFNNDEKFNIEIQLKPALQEWYKRFLFLEMDENWSIDETGRWHLSIFNGSPRIVVCPNNLAVACWVLLMPLCCLWYTGYQAYRHVTCKTIKVKVEEQPHYMI